MQELSNGRYGLTKNDLVIFGEGTGNSLGMFFETETPPGWYTGTIMPAKQFWQSMGQLPGQWESSRGGRAAVLYS